MIKRISKILIAAALVVGVFPLQAQATTNYSEASSNNYVYVDGSHWKQNSNGLWILADANFHILLVLEIEENTNIINV